MKSLFARGTTLLGRGTTLGLVALTLASTAYADSYTPKFKIYKLHTNHTTFDSLNIVSPDAMYNPAGCSDTSYYVLSPTVSSAGKELMGRMLTSAFLARRPIKLRLSSSNCTNNLPTYYAVELSQD